MEKVFIHKQVQIHNNSSVITTVIAGLAVGIIIGVLFAPDKGSETRKKICKKASAE